MLTQSKPKRVPPYGVLDIETRNFSLGSVDMTAEERADQIDAFDRLTIAEREARWIVGAVFDGSSLTYHGDAVSMVSRILVKRYRGWIFYAHFGGGFDFRLILPAIRSAGFDVKCLKKSGRLFAVTVTRGGHTWRFLDSWELVPLRLGRAGDLFKTEHRKLDIEYDEIEDSEETRAYLAHDCYCLHEVLTAFFAMREVKEAGHVYTRAQLSMNLFRCKYLKKALDSVPEAAEAFFRLCAYGGRTEVLKRSTDSIESWDINSSFPYAMTKPLPIGKPVRSLRVDAKGYYHVRVSARDIEIPGIPYRGGKGDAKVIFPTGTFETYITGLELIEASGYADFKILDGWVFPQREPILAEYVHDLWGQRMRSTDAAERTLLKLLLNSLYGKFGMRRERTAVITAKIPPIGADPVDADCGLWEVEARPSDARYIYPHISGGVTSIARIRLHREMDENTAYVDTDNVKVPFGYYRPVQRGSGLGEWKLEGRFDRGIFLAPKTYLLEGPDRWTRENSEDFREQKDLEYIARHKGIPRRAVTDARDLFADCSDAAVTWVCFDSLPERKRLGVAVRKRTRKLSRKDTKRKWDGNNSRPWHISPNGEII